MEKTCFKCLQLLSIKEFYKHPQMPDGHLNKCKSCAKKDVSENYRYKVGNVDGYIEAERKRGRQKYHRLYVGMGKAKPENNKRWLDKFPEKRKANTKSQHLPPPKPGLQRHHWSYKEEHAKDVIWLSIKHHAKAHRFIKYDQEYMLYRRIDNNALLLTKKDHREYIYYCIDNLDD